ncbi:unnamed protein product [Leptosia nina]|uniref:Uncharacterized protein n=1 Tax=Leptosia nina TaxID=320188 RepID=A0AAV1JU13_9NEOP
MLKGFSHRIFVSRGHVYIGSVELYDIGCAICKLGFMGFRIKLTDGQVDFAVCTARLIINLEALAPRLDTVTEYPQ